MPLERNSIFFNKMNGETSFRGEVQVRGRGNILSYYRTSNDLPKSNNYQVMSQDFFI